MAKNKRTYNLCIKRLIQHKHDTKFDVELFALHIAIQMQYKNCKLYNPTPYKIQELLNVGYTKACKLLAAAKADTSGLFHIAKKDKGLVALSDKRKELSYGKNGNAYYGDVVYKVEKGEYTLRQLVKTIRRAMLLYFILCASVPKNGATDKVESQAEPRMIKQKLMQHFCKMSRTSLNRLVNELADEGLIEKTPRMFQCVISCLNDETAAAYTGTRYFVNRKNNTAWVCFICSYLISETAKTSFKHVIWHNGKQRDNINTRMEKPLIVDGVDLNKYYNEMHD